jgi:uncharacterized membrane protein
LPEKRGIAGFVLIVLGILGIIVSLVTEQSDYDPTAFGMAAVSILLAIVGISLIFRSPPRDKGEAPT